MSTIPDDYFPIKSSKWCKKFAYYPIKLTNGKWIIFKSYYYRKTLGLCKDGFCDLEEYGDIFYVMIHPDSSQYLLDGFTVL